MRRYLLKRLLLFFPALGILVLVSFAFLRMAPGDPVDRMIMGSDVQFYQDAGGWTDQHAYWTHRLGLDLPLFYLSIGSLADHSVTPVAWKTYIPIVHFYQDNQFDRWLLGDGISTHGVLHGDFGISYSNGQKVSSLISSRIGWSLFFALFSVILAYLISLPLGLFSAQNPDSRITKGSSVVLIILFSLPVFWTATLLLMIFSNPDVLYILPASGVQPIGGFPEGSSVLQKIQLSLPYLVLPTISYTYASLAFLSRIFRVTISEAMSQDYIRTARAKGLPEKSVIRKHAFRNTLIPVITVFSSAFPAAIGGSVIIETIFSIPGMGLTIYQSIDAKDYPVLIAVFFLTGFITMSGFLLTDILYALADPRISFSKKTLS
jgi:peptide/nickel transport system permease protein